jgi:hypothetical protein
MVLRELFEIAMPLMVRIYLCHLLLGASFERCNKGLRKDEPSGAFCLLLLLSGLTP